MSDASDRPEGGARRGWRWTLLGGGILALVVLVAAVSRPRAPSVQTAAVKRSNLVVPVQCDGTLEPPPGGELRAIDSATVSEILVKNGDRVAPGAILLRLENTELTRQALDTKSEALRLEAERASTAADLSELELEERHAARVFDGDARLLESGAITRQTYETDELALSRAREKARSAKSRLSSFDGDRPNSSRLELARQSAADLERRVGALTVKAPAAGTVYGLPRRVGEAVSAGQVVANVIDPAHRRLRARVDQPDLPRTAVGQRLSVTFDGLPKEHWEGRVSFVDPALRDVNGREVGEVLGEIADPEAKLPSNAAVDVAIITGEKAAALVVPRASVFRDGDRRFVYVFDDGRARRREVTVGLLGLTEVEIVSGLGEKDTVILPGAVSVSDGARVRASGEKG